MPKKTKKQKMAAQQHKQHMAEMAERKIKLTFSEHKKEVDHEQKPAPSVNSTPKKPIQFTGTPDFFKKDLTKSLLISGLLILVQIGIYIGQMYGLDITTILPF